MMSGGTGGELGGHGLLQGVTCLLWRGEHRCSELEIERGRHG